MGCDIHALVERRKIAKKIEEAKLLADKDAWLNQHWINKGEVEIGRDYRLFSILASVRNYIGIKPIAEPRIIVDPDETMGIDRYTIGTNCKYADDITQLSKTYMAQWDCDGHSHSWLTLKEIKEADFDQVIQFSEGKKPLREGFDFEEYNKIIEQMESLKGLEYSDEDIRLVFFFDN